MTTPVANTDVVEQGVAKLTSGFKGTNVEGFVRGWLSGAQYIQTQAQAVLDALLNPTGDLLDRLAAVVGETRQGRSDVDFLAAYRIRVMVNASRGLTEDLLRIANALNPSRIYEGGIASWYVETSNLNAPNVLAEFLSEAKDGGTHGTLSYSVWDSSLDLVFGDFSSGETFGPGLGDIGGGYTGGLFYSLVDL